VNKKGDKAGYKRDFILINCALKRGKAILEERGRRHEKKFPADWNKAVSHFVTFLQGHMAKNYG
jgi:hypothetical protein